jgi:NAD(P)-dependent dehydrogenase (short-subunit alcohol dehydrogenase family)
MEEATLIDKILAVTGAGQGIGRAIASAAAAKGASVALIDINPDTVTAAAKGIKAVGGRALAIVADMSSSDAVADAFSRVEAELGLLTGLACVGMRRRYAPAESMSDEDWALTIGDGLTGYFRSAREAARRMLPRACGSIVFVTSTASRSAIVNGAAYVAAKSGITGLARQLGSEWADRGLRVNSVAPGYTPTEGAHRKLPEEDARRLIPMARVAQPEEIANACLFLLSDEASYITGQELVVDGGMVASRIFGRKSDAA